MHGANGLETIPNRHTQSPFRTTPPSVYIVNHKCFLPYRHSVHLLLKLCHKSREEYTGRSIVHVPLPCLHISLPVRLAWLASLASPHRPLSILFPTYSNGGQLKKYTSLAVNGSRAKPSTLISRWVGPRVENGSLRNSNTTPATILSRAGDTHGAVFSNGYRKRCRMC